MGSKKLFVVSGLVLSLALGFLGGILADRWYVQANFHRIVAGHLLSQFGMEGEHPPKRDIPGFKSKVDLEIGRRFIGHLAEMLDLKESQKTKIGEILKNRLKVMDELRDEHKKDIMKIIAETNSEIMNTLDARQGDIFIKHFAVNPK